MALLNFISDQHLYDCISRLYKSYIRDKKELNLRDLYRNKLDPIKTYFDITFNEITLVEFIDTEAKRKADKNINNHIGNFHQELLNGLNNFEAPKQANYDIRKLDNSIFGELKNKHNTMNSSSIEATFQKLQRYATDFPDATCYLIEVVAMQSQNNLWQPTCSGKSYSHPRIRKISIDKFYELATGRPNAFKELCDAIQIATPYVLEQIKSQTTQSISSMSTSTAYNELISDADAQGISPIEKIFKDNFNGYNGF